MTRTANEYERADHARDLAKHDERPGDRLTPMTSHALEIAILVKAVKDPREGAALIEQYACTREAEGVLKGVTRTLDRLAPPVRP
jgi:hypothetical protein